MLAVEDGYRESKESWLFVLRALASQGMQAPMLTIGDGALGFWAAVREVWPETKQQLCQIHYADARIMPTRDAELAPAAMCVRLRSA